MNWFNRDKKTTTEKSDVNKREQYTEDFKAFMEKSYLDFSQQNETPHEIIYIGYQMSKPCPSHIWLYALVGSDMIAAGLRVYNRPEHMHMLKEQEKDIQASFDERLEWRDNGVGISQYGTDPMDVSDQVEQFYFLRKTLETLDFVFRDRVNKLD